MPDGPVTTAERARRLLALLPYLRRQGETTLASLAAVTGTDAATVADDLTTLSMCGWGEDTDALVSVLVEGDRAIVFGPLPALEDPVRLTSAEARALHAALDACGVGADSALSRALLACGAKGADPEALARTIRASAVSEGTARTLSALEALASARGIAAISYTRLGASDAVSRRVWPLRCWFVRGAWYLLAIDEASGESRTFRVDRIGTVEATGEPFEPPADADLPADVVPDPAASPRALVRFARPEPGLDDRVWPGATFEPQPDGGVLVSVPYAGTAWIARQVVARLGRAVVLAPDDLRSAVAALARFELQLARSRASEPERA